MKLLALWIFACAACSLAATIPSCGSSCVARAIEKTNCAANDSKCICKSEHYLGYLEYCSTKKCSSADKDDAIKAATSVCNIVLQDINEDDATFKVQKRSGDHRDRGHSQHHSPPAPAPVSPGNSPQGPQKAANNPPNGPARGPPNHPLPSAPVPAHHPPGPASITWFTPTPAHTVVP